MLAFSAGSDGGRELLEHDDLEWWCGSWTLPWHRADLGFFGAHALSWCARVARMDSCGPLLATHFLLEKQTGEKTVKIKQAISSAILVLLLAAPTAWGQDNIRAAMEAANKEWSAAYNSMNGKAFPALYTKDCRRACNRSMARKPSDNSGPT